MTIDFRDVRLLALSVFQIATGLEIGRNTMSVLECLHSQHLACEKVATNSVLKRGHLNGILKTATMGSECSKWKKKKKKFRRLI